MCRYYVWHVDAGASNHTIIHVEGFKEMEMLERPSYVIALPIKHIGEIPIFVREGQTKYMNNVLHVPNTTKNLLGFGQMYV